MTDVVKSEPRPVVELMQLAQRGDRVAFAELKRVGDSRGISYSDGWSSRMVLYRLQDRASPSNLLARASVEVDLAATARDLSDPRDGPIERLLVARAALCAVDLDFSDLEHLRAIESSESPWEAETYDRRRDRAQRRLLQALQTLAAVRRMNGV